MTAKPLALHHEDLTAKLVAALERLARVIYALSWRASGPHHLTVLQVALLERLGEQPWGVRELAEKLEVARATVSRALKTMVQKGLVSITRSPQDGRQVVASLTRQGQEVSQKSQAWAGPLVLALQGLSAADRAQFWASLLLLLRQLERSGLMAENRMCLSCRFFRQQGHKLFCTLLEQPLSVENLRLHCPDFQGMKAFEVKAEPHPRSNA